MRSIISRKVLTAAAATGILSLTGGFALAANSHAGTGDSPGPGTAGQVQAPLPADVCGESMELGGFVAAAVGDLCAQAGEPDGYGDEPGEPTHPPTHPPTYPPSSPPHTEPPSSPPHTEPSTSPPHTEPPTSPPHTEPPKHTTPPPTNPEEPGECEEPAPGEEPEPGCEEPTEPPTTPPGGPELPDTGSDPALMGAAAISAALIIGGSVLYLRGGRISRRH